MSSRTLRFYFKLVYSSNTWELDINSEMSTADFVIWINKHEMRALFNIHEQYHIQVIKTSTSEMPAELGPPIMVSYSDTFGQRFNPKFTSFYLRPVHPITEEFIRRDDYSVAPNYTDPESHINTTPESVNQVTESNDAN